MTINTIKISFMRNIITNIIIYVLETIESKVFARSDTGNFLK